MRAQKENFYALIICIVLIVMAAFRSDAVGADTMGYRSNYMNMGNFHSFQDLVDRFSLYYMGYYIPSKLFHLVGLPVQVWFGFLEAFYLFALMKLVNRFSKDKIFSLLVFVTIGLFSFSLAGLKQTLAMSLMMLAFVAFVEKKYWLTALLVFLTYYTHQSALIFLGAFLLYFLKKGRWLILAAIVVSVSIYFYGYFYLVNMVDLIENEQWEKYLTTESGYSYVTFIFLSVITLIAGLNMKNYSEAEPHNSRYFLASSIIACGIQLLAGISSSMFRLTLPYMPFIMILLPNASYYSYKKKEVRIVLMVSIIFYYLYAGRHVPYSFVKLF